MLISKFNNHNIDNSVEIAKLENKYGIILPYQYREFMCRYNGGYTPKTKFRIGTISSDMRGFYGIGNVKMSFNTIQLNEWIENKTLPIACDSFGNYIVIGIDDNNNGKIFFCDHEVGYKLECLTENFETFIKCCESEMISEASRRSVNEREEILVAKGRGAIITEALRQMWQVEVDKYKDMIQEEVVIN